MTSEIETNTPFDPCGSIKDAFEDDDSFVQKFRNGKIKFKFPDFDFDRFCHTGQVIDEAAVEGQKTMSSGADMLPEKSRDFVAEHGPILKTKIKDGWTSSMDTLAMIPSKVSGFWNNAAKEYHENNENESDENSSSELAMR